MLSHSGDSKKELVELISFSI